MAGFSADSRRGWDGALDACVSALLFGGLALFLPMLWSRAQQSLRAIALPLWGQLADVPQQLAPQVQQALLWPLWGLLSLLGLAGLGWLSAWRLRRFGLSAERTRGLLPWLFGALFWGVGLAALLPRWLQTCAWPTESYGLAVMAVTRGLLLLCALSALLRAGLTLRAPS